jgi:hypothetical protein
MKNLLALMLLAATTTTTACVDTSSTDATDSDPGTEVPTKVTVNSLLPTNIAGTTLGLNALTASALTSLAQTAGGRSLISYMVDCAFVSAQSITVTVSGTNYTFTGTMGLATGWSSKALSLSDQQLVSSCVLSRVNYYGTAVNISDRGASTNLSTTSQELSAYVLEEGAFYGNILNSTTATVHACIGKDAQDRPTEGDLVNRKCTEQNGSGNTTYCGFLYDGPCETACTTTVTGSGHYDSCGGSHWTSVVTDFVQD